MIAGLLVLPAINGTRFQARVTACQDNLRQVGQALTEYSHRTTTSFPRFPPRATWRRPESCARSCGRGFSCRARTGALSRLAAGPAEGFRVPSLDELRSAVGQELSRIQQKMGGSYGYCLGYFDHGVFQPTRNLNRDYFAIMADAPSDDRPDHQSDNHGGLGQNVLFEDLHVDSVHDSAGQRQRRHLCERRSRSRPGAAPRRRCDCLQRHGPRGLLSLP